MKLHDTLLKENLHHKAAVHPQLPKARMCEEVAGRLSLLHFLD